jgi:hypothetical protein
VRGESGLGELVEDYLGRELVLRVYNHEYDVTRLVTITPRRGWGGEGALGCTLGYGALHRLPRGLEEPVVGEGEVLFEEGLGGGEKGGERGEVLVPAEMVGAKVVERLEKGGRGKRTPHVGVGDMDEYFREGEEKSREVEGEGRKSPLPPPPPPRMGGPPRGGSVGGEKEVRKEEKLDETDKKE